METECKKMIWAGRVLTALAAFPFIPSFIMKLTGHPMVIEGLRHFGWPESSIITLGVLEASCVILYLLPPTSILGAILLTGYLGGAICTHMRLGEPVLLHCGIGVLIWGGLYLRESRLRGLLPIRAKAFRYEREVVINRPNAEVFAYLKTLKNFKSWNPFLKKDSHIQLHYTGTDGEVGFIKAWDGNRQVGSGEQEITRIIEGKTIQFELRFKKPFKATNHSYFSSESLGGSKTKVCWGMTGMASFPMTVIGLFMNCDKMIGGEFEKGLAELKGLLEKY